MVSNTINSHPITALSNIDGVSQSHSNSLRRDRSATKFEGSKVYAHVSTHASVQTNSISPINIKLRPTILSQQEIQQSKKTKKK